MPDTLHRPELHPIPMRMRGRPVDHRGYPVPWFVTERDAAGRWDFANVRVERRNEALRHRRCWVSGEQLGRAVAFVIGPMCTINRVAADPPAIREIAEWSARVCPFLSRPLAQRPDFAGQGATPGLMVLDNPGMCAVWVTREWHVERDGLIRLGTPLSVSWWRKGRDVTGDFEARTIYEQRAGLLRKAAAEEGPEALAVFEAMKRAADRYAPATIAVPPTTARPEDVDG